MKLYNSRGKRLTRGKLEQRWVTIEPETVVTPGYIFWHDDIRTSCDPGDDCDVLLKWQCSVKPGDSHYDRGYVWEAKIRWGTWMKPVFGDVMTYVHVGGFNSTEKEAKYACQRAIDKLVSWIRKQQ